MPVPKDIAATLSPAEAEFLAESELVTISPLQRLPEMQFITGSYGPFRPPRRAQVPLWLAVTLRTRAKCTIEPPSWLSVDYIQAKIDHEKAHPEFSSLPFHYMEVAHVLLENASEDIPNADTLRTLLKDIRDIRIAKGRMGLRNIDPHYLQMDNLGAMEINEIRPYFTKTFNELRKFIPVEDDQGDINNMEEDPDVDAMADPEEYNTPLQDNDEFDDGFDEII